MLIYRTLSILLFPFIELYLFYRVYKKKEDKHRLRERFGKATVNRPETDIVWLHAVSVGETNSALILVDELLKSWPQVTILFTTTTLTSAKVVAEKLPQYQGRVLHQFLPVDAYVCVRNFLNFWRPAIAIFVESEIWPNLLTEANKMGSALFLVNARMSEKSVGKWYLASKFGFKVFDNFFAIVAQTTEDQKRLQQLTKNEVVFFGNLKSQAQNLEYNSADLATLKSQIGTRKFWLAASTHQGEEQSVLQTHLQLKKHFPDLLTILVPRHPNRAEEVKNLLKEVEVAQRSKKENIVDTTEIYLADTLGELGIFYRLSNIAFIGGSLLPIGGHNPFEPIKLGCAVISGLQVFNFKEIYRNLQEQDACAMVENAAELAQQVQLLLQNDESREAMARKATSVIEDSNNIAAKIVDKISQIIVTEAISR